MFAVIYRGYVKPGLESNYQKQWHKIASYFIKHRGAIGSSLHKTHDDMWVAYSRWPNKATRDASWPGDNPPAETLPQDIKDAIVNIKNCVDESRKLPEIHLEVIEVLGFNE